MTQTLEDYRWLVSDAAELWLERVREELAAAGGPSVALLARLRKDLSASQAHLVVEQVELRERAGEKFTQAQRMFFTRKGLEQATDERIAAAKALRFPADAPVADLCCGIGGDGLALAGRAGTVGVDRDPVMPLLANANAMARGLSETAFHAEAREVTAKLPGHFAAWHIDPDRRPDGNRTTRVELYEPSLELLDRLLAANASAAIKLAPAAEVPAAWVAATELCWLGSRGECRQQVAWFGSLARHPGQHSATVVDARGGERTIVGSPAEPVPVAAQLGRYVFEPHSAVLAAKLTGALCRMHSQASVSSGNAYLTSDILSHEPALAAFEVLDVLPFDQKRLKAYFRQRVVGRLEVKKRGIDIDPERLRKAIIGQGEQSATLIVTPVLGQSRAIVARRISPPPSAGPAA